MILYKQGPAYRRIREGSVYARDLMLGRLESTEDFVIDTMFLPYGKVIRYEVAVSIRTLQHSILMVEVDD